MPHAVHFPHMNTILNISHLEKKYENGVHALKDVSLSIRAGELFALLGPNGAGKTTLIGIVCGTLRKTSGTVTVDTFDAEQEWRTVRSLIGYVPQELTLNQFDSVWDTLHYQRGFYGRERNDTLLEKIIRDLSLWDKRHTPIRELSGGMKRRVLIGKALTNEPKILFLDEPSAGVDVELRKEMWEYVRALKENGTTIVLTTHYLEEAEMLADRIGIIRQGELVLVSETQKLLSRLGKKTYTFRLTHPLTALPKELDRSGITLAEDGKSIVVHCTEECPSIESLLDTLCRHHISLADIDTQKDSLENIFLTIIEKK